MKDPIQTERIVLNRKIHELNGLLLKQVMVEFFEEGSHLNVVMDEQGVILQVNTAWQVKLGWEKHELVNCSLTDLLDPEDARRTSRILELVNQHKKQTEGFRARFRNREGEYRMLTWNFYQSENQKFNFGVARVVS